MSIPANCRCGASLTILLPILEKLGGESGDLEFEIKDKLKQNKKSNYEVLEAFGYDHLQACCIATMLSAILPKDTDLGNYKTN